MSIKLIDALTAVVLIVGWWIAFSVYPRLPEKVPVRFGVTGEADSWGGRWAIFLAPLIGTVVIALNYWIFEYLSPGSPRPIPMEMMTPLRLLLLEVSLMCAYITWRMSEVAFGRARGLGVWFPVTLIAVFATCGWMLVLGRGH
ncbi:MAG TPA: DUF1648 domain-containing protein [Blastocatellia bacterium]|jgi:hypothetical protein|nr:DUF1648 domain-containing protein [Blastocatellia bacterium]